MGPTRPCEDVSVLAGTARPCGLRPVTCAAPPGECPRPGAASFSGSAPSAASGPPGCPAAVPRHRGGHRIARRCPARPRACVTIPAGRATPVQEAPRRVVGSPGYARYARTPGPTTPGTRGPRPPGTPGRLRPVRGDPPTMHLPATRLPPGGAACTGRRAPTRARGRTPPGRQLSAATATPITSRACRPGTMPRRHACQPSSSCTPRSSSS